MIFSKNNENKDFSLSKEVSSNNKSIFHSPRSKDYDIKAIFDKRKRILEIDSPKKPEFYEKNRE